jgi:hypothetical protein
VNFPEPLVLCLDEHIPKVSLIPWDTLHPDSEVRERVARLFDWRLVLCVSQEGYDGLITLNYKMLADAAVLTTIDQTGMTVVACGDYGHLPTEATGLLLLNLPNVLKNFGIGVPWAWHLKAGRTSAIHFKAFKRKQEERFGLNIAAFRLTKAELTSSVLDQLSEDRPALF